MSWPRSFLWSALWLAAGSAGLGACFLALSMVVEFLEDYLRQVDSTAYIEYSRLVDTTAAVVLIVVTLAIGVSLVVGSARVHHTKRIVLCMVILLMVGGCVAGLLYLAVSMYAWPAF